MQENVYISNNTKPHTVPALGEGSCRGREFGQKGGWYGKRDKERWNQSGIW